MFTLFGLLSKNELIYRYLKTACVSMLRFMLLEQTTAIVKSLMAIVSPVTCYFANTKTSESTTTTKTKRFHFIRNNV